MEPVLQQATEPGSNLTIHPFPLDLGLGDEPVDPNDLPQPPDPLWRWVDDAFADACSLYFALIGPLVGRRSAQPEDLDFPSIVIGIEAAWRPDDLDPTSGKPDPKNVIDSEEIVFDGDLLAQLLEIYTFDGWRPLVTIGKELKLILHQLEKLEQKAHEGRAAPSDLAQIDRLAKWKPAE